MVEGAARLPLFCILTPPCPRRTIREAPYATRFFALQKPPAHRLLPANYRMPGANDGLVGSNDSLPGANDRAMHSWPALLFSIRFYFASPLAALPFCRKQRIDYFCADLYPYDSPFAPASSRASIYAPICRIGQTQRQWQKAKRPR